MSLRRRLRDVPLPAPSELNKPIGVVLGALLAILTGIVFLILFIGGWKSVPIDKVGLHLSGGPIEGQKYRGVVEPGSGARFYGLLDQVAELPVNQRNYIVSKRGEEGDRRGQDFIRVPAKGGIAMDFEVSVYFKLNTSEKVLPVFYREICTKYNCTEQVGWDTMLNDNFRKMLETSMRARVFEFTVDELYANAQGEKSGDQDAIRIIQNEIASALKDNVNSVLGGEYFCGPQFNRDNPDVCPDFQFIINSAEPTSEAIRTSFDEQRVALNSVQTAQNRALAKKAEAEGILAAQQASQAALTPQYLRLREIEAMEKCAASANCTLVVTPGGTNVNVQSGQREP